MQRPFPTPVETWHNASYNAIDPQRPELSVADKVIIITGGGTGIGRETVKAFAAAGAKAIHVLGRTQASLAETRSIVEEEFPSVEVSIHVADVADVSTVEKAATVIGRWDVLVSNAGYLPKSRPIQEVDLADWWLGFEVNLLTKKPMTKMLIKCDRSMSRAISSLRRRSYPIEILTHRLLQCRVRSWALLLLRSWDHHHTQALSLR